jgi:DNA integrity scanning protein DisA with diadenylate cyclase activity
MTQGRYVDLLEGVDAEKSGVNPQTLERVILLATEIAREGREGRRLGTMFVVGDTEEALKRSRCLILDPLWHHPDELKRLDLPDMRETVKELAQLDGAFIVSNKGVVVSACRYIDVLSKGIDLPLGLGSRHMAAASITHETDAMAVVVSESSIVRVFDDGEIVSEVIPELWLLRSYGLHLVNPMKRANRTEDNGGANSQSKQGE